MSFLFDNSDFTRCILCIGFLFEIPAFFLYNLSGLKGAHSKVVLRGIRIAEAGVRFSLGPQNKAKILYNEWRKFPACRQAGIPPCPPS